MFINYSPLTGNIAINTYRNSEGYANSDVCGFVEDIIAGRPASCPFDGAKAALEDGSLFAELSKHHGDAVVQEAVEVVHAAICELSKLPVGIRKRLTNEAP